ncbi:MAG TPA: hypothetical protein VGM91_24240 [Conexibacter sp.]|jgi:hypothetical protein
MTRPSALFGRPSAGSFISERWELRITRRCLEEDLGVSGDSAFEDVSQREIVKAFVKDRRDRVHDTRQVAPLTCGVPVWVLARGDDHRAATWYDEDEEVVWLLAYGIHRSGEPDDFFPDCKQIDAADRLLPVAEDYTRMFDERGERFVHAVRIEAPLILRAAREAPGEHRYMLGGEFGACITVEVDDELDAEAVTIAFRVDSLPFSHVSIVLAAFYADHAWEPVTRMPGRGLHAGEFAYTHTRVG